MKKKTAEQVLTERDRRLKMLNALVDLPEFKEWMYSLLEEFCGFSDDTVELTPFGQGIRCAANFMKNSLAEADHSNQFIGDLYARHYSATRTALIKRRKDEANV